MQLNLKNPLLWLGLALAAIAVYFFAFSANAQAGSWTGCYVGGVGSYSALVEDGGGDGAEGPGIAATAGCDSTLIASSLALGPTTGGKPLNSAAATLTPADGRLVVALARWCCRIR